jgi:2'-5' RNA ligase
MRWVIVIFIPPSPIDTEIRTYRERYDPLAGHIEPHVTLMHPFENDIEPTELQAIVAQLASTVEPFQLTLREVTPFPDGYIYLNVKQGNDTIIALRDQLHAGPLAGHKSRRDTYVPHVTIGQAHDEPTLDEALADAAALDLDVTVVAREITAFCFDDQERRHVEFVVPLEGRAVLQPFAHQRHCRGVGNDAAGLGLLHPRFGLFGEGFIAEPFVQSPRPRVVVLNAEDHPRSLSCRDPGLRFADEPRPDAKASKVGVGGELPDRSRIRALHVVDAALRNRLSAGGSDHQVLGFTDPHPLQLVGDMADVGGRATPAKQRQILGA